MTDIMISKEDIQYINMTSKITKTDILDCITTDDKIILIVRKGQLGVALGYKAKNLERLRDLFKKTIKFVEFDPDIEKFIINLCKPYKVNNIELEGDEDSPIVKVEVKISDKSKLIGKEGSNIDIIRKLARRHHSIKDVQVK